MSETLDERIDGVAYLMSPAPDLEHQEIAGETTIGALPGIVIGWDALVARLRSAEE